jgi:hypothetical protein
LRDGIAGTGGGGLGDGFREDWEDEGDVKPDKRDAIKVIYEKMTVMSAGENPRRQNSSRFVAAKSSESQSDVRSKFPPGLRRPDATKAETTA